MASPERMDVTVKPKLLLAALLAGLTLCACGAQKQVRVGVCDAHREWAALVTRYVIVYGAPRTGLPPITTFYACLRPEGRALSMGLDELGGLYGSDATSGGFRAAGTLVAAQSSSGEAALAVCARYSNPRRCPPARHWFTVADAQSRRRARIPVYASLPVPALVPFPVTLALSPTCAVAWLENATVGANVTGRLELWATVLTHRGRTGLAAAPAMIDAGSIDSSSVRFEGRTLYWVRDDELHREALH